MYNVLIATTGFRCPLTGIWIRRGDVYLENEGKRIHISQLPKRKLTPLKQYKDGQHIAVQSNKSRV